MSTERSHASQPAHAVRVLWVSGLFGFLLGLFRFPTWQIAVESAQVVAGLVQYPAGNPFYIYHTSLWTIVHQIAALMLRAGLSEIAVSRLLSGLLGMVSFQALSVFVYALSGRALLAIASTVVIFLTGAAEQWDIYPIALMGTPHTYGVLGLSTIVLVVALFGAGCYRTAGFLLGFSPAVHPSLAVLLWVTTAICLAWDFRALVKEFRPAFRYFLSGCAFAGLSLLVQLAFIRDAPPVDSMASAKYFNAFVAAWDFHRAPTRLVTRAMALNLAAFVLALGWPAAFRRTLPRSEAFVLRVVAVAAILSAAFALLSRLPPGRLPMIVTTLMPARIVTFNVMAFAALVLGLLGSCRSRYLNTGTTALLLAVMLAQRYPLVLQRVQWGSEWREFHDRTNDPFFATVAAEQEGLVLTGGSLQLVQLTTRRPVLLDGGGLDALPYARESGPEMQRILVDVYGVDLLNPPAEALRGGIVPSAYNKTVWQRYSREKWLSIGRTYHVTQVVTPADWSLDLPLAATGQELRLYRIPG